MVEQRYRSLEIWKRGIELAKTVYEITKNFPHTEVYGLASHLQRAAVSVPSNIAEGSYRKTANDFCQFLSIAAGSLAEVDTQLEIASELGYFFYEQPLRDEICGLLKMIRSFSFTLTHPR